MHMLQRGFEGGLVISLGRLAPITAGRYRSSLATDALVCSSCYGQTQLAGWIHVDLAICAPKSSLRLTLSMILLVIGRREPIRHSS